MFVRRFPHAVYLGVTLGLIGCNGKFATEVTVPRDAIQKAVDGFLPVKASDYVEGNHPAEVTLTKATVLLRDGSDKIGVDLAVTVNLPEMPVPPAPELPGSDLTEKPEQRPPGPPAPLAPGPDLPKKPPAETTNKKAPAKTVHGSVIVLTGVRYDAQSASFYCQSPATEKVDFEELPDELEQLVRKLSEEAMTAYLSENAVYRIDDQQTATRLAKSALQDVTVRDGKLIVKIGI